MKPACVYCGLALCTLVLFSWTEFSTADPISADQPLESKLPAPPENPGAVPGESALPPFSASWSITMASRYIFQGFDYSDGKAVMNPALDLVTGPVTAKVWANHNLDSGLFDEFDFSLVHERSAKHLSFAAGYTYLSYPNREGWDPSQEFFIDLSHDGMLNPSLSVHYDFDAGTGTYSTLRLSHSFETRAGTASLGTNLFYQGSYYGMSGIPSLEGNVNFSHSFGRFSVTPSISRFLTWENGDFRAANALPAEWLFSLQVGHGI